LSDSFIGLTRLAVQGENLLPHIRIMSVNHTPSSTKQSVIWMKLQRLQLFSSNCGFGAKCRLVCIAWSAVVSKTKRLGG